MRVDRQQMLVSLAVLVYLGLGLYLSRVLVTWDDEGGYLALGRKLVTGELTSLFVDELSGHRMPLPFYVLGASQFFGPSLLAGRWLSLALGLGVLGLAVVVARRLEGPTAGVLAGDRKSTRLNSSHTVISYAVFCLKKKKTARAQ